MAGESRQQWDLKNFAVLTKYQEPRRDTRAPGCPPGELRPRPGESQCPRVKTGTSAPETQAQGGEAVLVPAELPDGSRPGVSWWRRSCRRCRPHGQAPVQPDADACGLPEASCSLLRAARTTLCCCRGTRRFPCRRTWPSWRAPNAARRRGRGIQQGLQLVINNVAAADDGAGTD